MSRIKECQETVKLTLVILLFFSQTKCLEDERLQNEELLSKFKELLNSQKEENRRLTKQVEEQKALQHKLQE